MIEAPKTVADCYDFTRITSLAGLQDYTEGKYDGDPSISYEIAQRNQHNYLLDEVGAGEGFRLLEVGCGLGTLLEVARERGVRRVGITISEDQVAKCRAKGLDVRLHNYRNLPSEFDGAFDGAIANGSIEHFCQPGNALAGKQEAIYREMFGIFGRVLDSTSEFQKVATTVIHFCDEPVDARKFLKHPFLQLRDSEGFHFAVLHRGYGGYYPFGSQLEDCAGGKFDLIKEVDGTADYHTTSEYWAREFRRAFFTNLRFVGALSKLFLKRPAHTVWMAMSQTGPTSWAWQFRGENPPTKLLRQTWKKSDS
jgi:cyclopropane fatty-acyl-phospholipid synthase-like methyltransferase